MESEARNARLGRARAQMERAGVELLAVSPSDDLRYLAGFSPTADERPCMFLLGRDDAVFVVPSLNAVQARSELPELRFETWEDADGAENALRAALALFGSPARVAVDAAMRADFLLLLQRLAAGAEFVPGATVLGELRLRKDAAELEALWASARTADEAMAAALAACAVGARELDVAEAAAAAFRRAGCEEVMFTSVASGPNGAFPHHHTGDRELRASEAVTIDIGGRLHGYQSDITRMAHLGEPGERYREIHAAVEAAVRAGIDAARPGGTCGSVDRAARAAIEAAGFGEQFVHRTGHGLGLSGHEPPWIMAGEERRLEPGMVFSIEPGIYVPGEMGLRLEEIVVLTETGCELLSGLPRDARIVA
jgi:Xaa-Pro aminopeptidase